MRMPNRVLSGGALLVVAAFAQAAPCSNLEPARWLLGQWAAESGDKRVLETWREAGRLVFENPTHDFPRRLEYTMQPDGGLEVSVSDGAERGFKLQFRRPDRT